jgi:hypothetical protein
VGAIEEGEEGGRGVPEGCCLEAHLTVKAKRAAPIAALSRDSSIRSDLLVAIVAGSVVTIVVAIVGAVALSPIVAPVAEPPVAVIIVTTFVLPVSLMPEPGTLNYAVAAR